MPEVIEGPKIQSGWWDWAPLIGLVAVVAGLRYIGGLPQGCRENFHIYLALTGDGQRVTQFLRACEGVGLGAAREALLFDIGFAVVYGAVLFAALKRWWPKGWRTTLLRERLSGVVWVPVAAAAFDIAENVVLIVGLTRASDGAALAVPHEAAVLAAVFGWWKFLLAGIAVIALLAAVAGICGYWRMGQLPREHEAGEEVRGDAVGPYREAKGIGICLSGGGIRAASFALGGLQGLDERRVFACARYLSAVSGGAYTAVAWRIARETGARALQVLPQRTDDYDGILASDAPGGPTTDREATPRNLYSHIRTHRRYLATGRGGVPWNVLVAVVFLAVNVAVLAVALYLLAWPLGRLASLPFVLGDKLEGSVHVALYGPAALAGAAALAALLYSLVLEGPRHVRVLKVAAGALAAGALALLLLVGLPVLLDNAESIVPWLNDVVGGDGAEQSDAAQQGGLLGGLLGLLAALGIGGALLRIVMKPVGKAAPRLGGALLAVVAAVFAVVAARDAALGLRMWSLPKAYLLVAGAFAVFYYFANLRAWSLHTLYLARLRSTFSTRQSVEGVVRSRPWGEEQSWDHYRADGMPQLLICASAQRQDRTGTGIPAVSFVFSPEAVAMYDHRVRKDGSLEVHEHAVPAESYAELLSGPVESQLTKPSAAAAISGAAVTSAMGRFNFGTTNALLAALNVRLGVWLPNPRYIEAQDSELRPFKRTRLNYLVKEIFGIYDLREPFVYVTDGGHWENLGLVELFRRRCKRIFCIDASGDPPGSAATLRDALVLAEVECDVTVDIDNGLKRLEHDPHTGVAEDCVAVGLVRYHHSGEHRRHSGCAAHQCSYGELYFAKAVVSRYAPDSVVAYAMQDRRFPGYSTADQFLGRVQFERLVTLGRAATERAALLAAQLRTALNDPATPVDLDEALVPVYEPLMELRA